AGTLEIQAMLVDADPDAYYVPPYVGHRGWLGVRLDRDLPWSQVESLVEAAHALCRPKPTRRA
ncbi:MAG TPA: MmcQ/YjbR family DNA-binding protein, partial [Kofleriaceae bacterium]